MAQRTQQRQRQEQTAETAGYVQSDAGVVFRAGVMHFADQPQVPQRVQHWLSSNGLTQYTTVEWRDPLTGELRTSCNCPGWTHARKGQKRACCHTQDLEGAKHCDRERVDPQPVALRSIAQIAAQVATITDTRSLRAIQLD